MIQVWEIQYSLDSERVGLLIMMFVMNVLKKKKKIEERERETEREKYRMGAPYYLCIYLLIFCYIYTNSELTNNNNKKEKAFNTHDIHTLIN